MKSFVLLSLFSIGLLSQAYPTSFCEEDQDCRLNNTICEGRFCTCDPYRALLDPEVGKCRTKVGFGCSFDQDCVQNAVCETGDPNYCTCTAGYVQNPQDACSRALKFYDPCDPGADCGRTPFSEIECLQGRCACKFGQDQYYDSGQEKCVSYEGKPCAASCIEHSECLDVFQRDGQGNVSYPRVSMGLQCVCDPGFVPNPEHKCIKE